MKGIAHRELLELGAQILLCNTYHLHLQPGEAIVKDAGGLHSFIDWSLPILTDSGGYQVFSLRKISTINDDGVTFQSHINGDTHFIGPEEAMRIQHDLGSDIIMCFDQCIASTSSHAEHQEALRRTLLWAERCKKAHEALCSERGRRPLLFGIVQGGLFPDLRRHSAEALKAIGFDGYAVGGLAVGETEEEMLSVLKEIVPHLPDDKPRYLMGVGDRGQLKAAVDLGIDMFDCVLPMREARHGSVHMSDGSVIRISNSMYRDDHSIIDPQSPSPLSRTHKKSYLHHLFKANERYYDTIACMQNIGVTLAWMRSIRERL
jgi:queuine tRNA-ribosyltransferase